MNMHTLFFGAALTLMCIAPQIEAKCTKTSRKKSTKCTRRAQQVKNRVACRTACRTCKKR